MLPWWLISESQAPTARQAIVRPLERWQNSRLLVWLFTLAIVAAIVSRRPDAVFHAQFWAEDGAVWFANGYNFGVLPALLRSSNGYFQTFPRLAAAVALAFPLRDAPLAMNLLAIGVQALPPMFLLTHRCAHLGGLRVRLLMGFLLLAVPTLFEVHANVTNSAFFLALLAFLVFVAKPPETTAWRIFDIGAVSLSGATGPFAVFLLPVGALVFWIRRRRWTGILLGIESCAAAVQAITILRTAGVRAHAPLGATPTLLVRIVGGQVIVSPLLGLKFLVVHAAAANLICAFAFVGAVLVLVYVFRAAPLELKLFNIFSISILAAALKLPLASLTDPQWPLLLLPGFGGRYWLIPVVSLLWAYVWMLGNQRPAAVRAVAAILVAAALCTGVASWRYNAFVDLDFSRYAREFQQAPVGQDFTIPINPGGWTMVLRKH